MPSPVRANRRGLRLKAPVDGTPTVDVYFDDQRVWSTKLPAPEGRRRSRWLAWPPSIRPRLQGVSTLTIRNSADSSEIASGRVQFGRSREPVRFVDPQGRRLAMNKWNRLGVVFEGDSSGMQQRLLATAAEVAAHMREWGYPLYMVGGNLLGAMRSGQLMAHDDDIDFAFYTDASDPQDVTLVGFEVERKLVAAGYTVVRHSHTHLEIVCFTDELSLDYYIDIFTGWHSADGKYNQPFALRGELARSDLLPVKDLEISGVPLPAPAVPEAWLAFAYGPNWRVPDPSFIWTTPLSTLRRFENSFGVFNRQRVFWEKTWQEVDKRADPEPGAFADTDRFLEMLPPHSLVVDLGCGDGAQAERIAAAGHEVIGVDYSYEALRVAKQTAPPNVSYRFLNLNDRHSLVDFGLDLIEQGRRPFFYARNVIHEIPALARGDLFTLLRGVLEEDTFLFAVFDANPVLRVPANPETWHLTVPTLRREAWRWKLGVRTLAHRTRHTPYGARTSVAAVISL